ncbi:hypothetical protein HAX54_045047, partial [Datura stramonium]|nr:hypothetical protein [Datura stramonium]
IGFRLKESLDDSLDQLTGHSRGSWDKIQRVPVTTCTRTRGERHKNYQALGEVGMTGGHEPYLDGTIVTGDRRKRFG